MLFDRLFVMTYGSLNTNKPEFLPNILVPKHVNTVKLNCLDIIVCQVQVFIAKADGWRYSSPEY